MRVAVFSTHKFEKDYLINACSPEIHLEFFQVPLSPKTVQLAKGFDGVCIFVNDNCNREVVEQLNELGVKYIVTRSAGHNQIDTIRAGELGVRVANCPEYSPYAIAEHTIALIMTLNRKIIRAHNRIKELNFSLDGLVGFDVHGKTVGVIGAGKIGGALVHILNGFGATILINDLEQDSELMQLQNVSYADLDDVISTSDIISLHVPLTAKTHHMINEETISKMKDGVMLINTSRGGLINTKHVINALKTGKIAYLGLDVYEEESGLFFEDHSDLNALQDEQISRLMTFKNVLITSHQAFLTSTALTNIADTTVANLINFYSGEHCPNDLVEWQSVS